ncbi:hypothetical protein BURMUCGD1_6281 [Burkholderia multivorans CGD1]|nr:hypothetical protein BURMUCGD1_6281 [Burkholderia multivorans CGD1]
MERTASARAAARRNGNRGGPATRRGRAGRLPMQDYPLPAACRQSTICCASRKKN